MSLESKVHVTASQRTGSEKVIVMVVLPTAPLTAVMVGRVVSGAVAVAWRACGASVPLPAASLIPLLAEAPSESIVGFARVVSTNAPFGGGFVSGRVAEVTRLSRAALQAGMLSLSTGLAA